MAGRAVRRTSARDRLQALQLVAKGFVEGMGGTLEAEDTPGGGLTMVVELEMAQ